jgi:acyl-coenzyme A synthetase/AMP-(fatty) acid ligase
MKTDPRIDHRWATPATFNFGTDVVDRWAREADHLALIYVNGSGEQRRLRFSDVAELSDRLAGALAASGVERGDRVIIMLPRSPEWMVSMVAALKIGAVCVPCIEMLTARDLSYRVTNSSAKAIICRSESALKFAGLPTSCAPVRVALGGHSGWLDFEALSSQASAPTPAVVDAEDPAVMYYTSGSTGAPKGVVHSARALHAWRYGAMYWLDLSDSDVIWCTADTGWSKAGNSILFGPWNLGATAFIYDGPFEPARRPELIARYGVTVYCASATELGRVADEADLAGRMPTLRRTVSAGEAVSPVIAERWERATGMKVREGYGQTETLMLAYTAGEAPVRYGSMGRPAPGCDLAVIDELGRRLPPGEEGDLALRLPNPQLMLTYWRDEARARACQRSCAEATWYVTGDRGYSDADGYLWYRGRADDVINSSGYRIGPMEVESVLLEHPAVAGCAVVGAPDPARGEIIKAFVVLRDGHLGDDALREDLQRHARRLTAPYKYPRVIEFIDELPMTATGKIRRRDLRERA